MNERLTPISIKGIACLHESQLSITLKRFLINYCIAYIDVSDRNSDLINPFNGIAYNVMNIDRFSESLNDPTSFKKEFYRLIEMMEKENITYLKLLE